METAYRTVRRSVDARQRDIKVNLTLLADDDGNPIPKETPIPLYEAPVFQYVGDSNVRIVIVGCGPAGLFAGLTALELGIKPVIYERGKNVSDRKRDIAALNRNLGLNPESNYCFGEGGAGTFSDGKLFSRSKKRGDMQRVMELFHYFGAPDTVLYEAHAHIGSDRLPRIIQNIRECIIEHGGEIHFETRIDSLQALAQQGDSVILGIGHSAHDTYRMLADEGVAMEAKGFAMGVRVEHPQSLINDLFYHLEGKSSEEKQRLIELLGNASYALVTQVPVAPSGQLTTGVYSFCMCPGGHMVPAGSQQSGCVVNGMSASHRNSPYANSGIVVELHPETGMEGALPNKNTALAALDFQEHLESLAKQYGGGAAQAPAQRLRDFVEGRESKSLPACSYLPGVVPSRLDQWLPEPIRSGLQQGFRDFNRKHPGYLTNDAIIVGVESRSSSPVRIVRDPQTMRSISHPWLYPVGEGAGYAGGITSSALDGMNAVRKFAETI